MKNSPAHHSDSLALAGRACNGDRKALGTILKRYEERVRRIVRVRLGPQLRARMDSMDVVQEAFAIAVRKIGELELKEEADLLKWLTRVATRQILEAANFHGADKRDPAREAPQYSTNGMGAMPAREAPVWKQVEQQEDRETLDSALSELPEHYREIILLRDYHGGSWAFVASEMGSPTADAAMKQYHRAWIRLRRTLGLSK